MEKTLTLPRAATAKKINMNKLANRTLHYLVLTLLAVITVYPFWWTLVTALSTSGDVFTYPPRMWPENPGLDNFIEVFKTIDVIAFYKNSIIISVLTVAG
ncbi:MAG: carbohydrate ABC transporter permease, partial [Vogesella sp.]|nr:carbohydrate ABC transporter permease [Vogesella sp.]